MSKMIVVKIGGVALGSSDTTMEDLVCLQKQGRSLVVVHGGGQQLTEWLARQGISTRFVHGKRVTDEATLEVAAAVLAGLTNKEIVAALNNRGGRVIGLSGVDGALLQSRIEDVALGYVGEVVKVDTAILGTLLAAGYIPVISSMGLHSVDRPAGAPLILNINADSAAGEIAVAMGAASLIFLTDVAGVADQSGKLLSRLSIQEAEALLASGVVSEGMIPKVQASLRTLATTTTARIVDGREPHALLREIGGYGDGTTIYKD